MSYVDVFVSHKLEDQDKAIALEATIRGWGFSCYIDADDPELVRMKSAEAVDERALADRIRGRLRNCRCFIYAYSARSLRSRWMQWELGFFDGRWGPRHIGLYDLDDGRGAAEQSDGRGQTPGVPEFLHIYRGLTSADLREFLADACSTRALADRADVDVDRAASLLAGMSRDPINFMIDAWDYLIAFQQQCWTRGVTGFPQPAGSSGRREPDGPLPADSELWRVAMRMNAGMREMMQPFADAMKPSPHLRQLSDAATGAFKERGENALAASRDFPGIK
jgi:hypothetical protein